MLCKICTERSAKKVFTKKVLNKFPVEYFRCQYCGFMFTEDPFWLDEAYSSPISSLDIGLISRNNHLSTITRGAINSYFNKAGVFLDYGGGYGMFTRLMRDAGLNFFRQDLHCENIFAKGFDLTDTPEANRFELITAFEVFEHLPDPLKEAEKMLSFSDSILFSTELQPRDEGVLEKWWYLVPETGQHIAFYTLRSLEIMAKNLGLHLYSNGVNIHLMTSRTCTNQWFSLLTRHKVSVCINTIMHSNPSLLSEDFQQILGKLR